MPLEISTNLAYTNFSQDFVVFLDSVYRNEGLSPVSPKKKDSHLEVLFIMEVHW